MDRVVVCAHQDASVSHIVTVAILAQGTSWAVAVTQAFLSVGSSPGRDICKRWICEGCTTTSFPADGHTASNAPDLFRPPKLSGAGPG